MAYAFRKIYTNTDSGYIAIAPTVGTVVTFDPNSSYDYVQNIVGNTGLVVYGVNSPISWCEGDTLVVVSYDPTTLVSLGNPDWLVTPQYTIEYVATNGFDATFKGYFDLSVMRSDSAAPWALLFGDPDDVVSYITQEADMTYWVQYVRPSDFDRFAPSIVDQEWIYTWATTFDSEDFFNKLTDQQYIFQYALYFPDRTAQVKPLLTDPYWIDIYNQNFPDDQIVVTPTPTPSVTITPQVTLTPEPTVTPTSSTP